MSNPYQTPGYQPPSFTPQSGAGSLDGALNGEYDFTVNEIFAEAWEKTAGAKGAFWGAILFIGFISVIGGMVQKALLGNGQASQIFGGLLILPITGPLYIGLFKMGVRRAAGETIAASDVFRYLSPYNVQLVIVQVLVYLAIILGFMALLLPGIYLAISYTFAPLLVADHGLQPWDAMETCRKSVGHKWWKFFGYFLLTGLMFIASCIPLGLGLIWALPTFVIANGVLYRRVFGPSPESVA